MTPNPTMHDASPDAPARHTTVINSDQAIVEVRFAEDDGTWFRVLNWFIDSGALAGLSPSATKVFLVLLRHASRDRTSLPSRDTLIRDSGLSKSQVYNAIAELEAGDELPREVSERYARLGRPPARLIRRVPHGAWEVFPDRPFAGRRDGPQAAAPAAPPVRNSGLPRGGRSGGPDKSSGGPESESGKPDVLKRSEEKRDVVGATAPPPADDDGVDSLRERLTRKAEGGLSRREAEDLLAAYPAPRLADALENALYTKKTGKLRGSLRGCIWHYAKQGYGLFEEVRRERAKATAVSPEVRLREIMRPRVAAADARTRETLQAVYGDERMTLNRRGVTPAELEQLGADEVFDLVVKRAHRALGRQA